MRAHRQKNSRGPISHYFPLVFMLESNQLLVKCSIFIYLFNFCIELWNKFDMNLVYSSCQNLRKGNCSVWSSVSVTVRIGWKHRSVREQGGAGGEQECKNQVVRVGCVWKKAQRSIFILVLSFLGSYLCIQFGSSLITLVYLVQIRQITSQEGSCII